MKKRLLTFICTISVIAASLLTVSPALAAGSYTGACAVDGATSSDVCKTSTANPLTGSGGALTDVVSVLSIIGGIVAVIFLIIGGIKYILSSGDSAKLSSAKNTIIYALVGVVVVVLARAIISFVLDKV